MKLPIIALAFSLVFLPASKGLARDIYVSQNGGGGTNSVAWLTIPSWQQPSAWGTNNIRPGDMIHLVGVITNPLAIAFSGVPGSNVTILFESNAMLSAPTLTGTTPVWIGCGGMSNLVIDGGVNGVIQCTDNGTPSPYWDPATGRHGTCDYTNFNMEGIYASPVNNFTVRNLTISNLYNRLRGSDDPPSGNYKATAFQIGGNNITIQNNIIYNTQDGIDYTYGFPASSNLVIVGNTIMGFNHGIQLAAGNSGNGITPLFYNAIIRSNRIDGMDFYESTNAALGASYHRDPFFLFNLATDTNFYSPNIDPCRFYIGCASNIDISYNFIGPGVNPQVGGIGSAGSAGIFIHDYSSNQMQRVLIYNNIFVLMQPLAYGDGYIDGGYAVDSLIANNTMVGWATNIPNGGSLAGYTTNTTGASQLFYAGPTGITAAAGYSVFNNILYNVTSQLLYYGQLTTNNMSSFGTTNLGPFSDMKSDYNVYQIGNGGTRFWFDLGVSFGTRAGYLGCSGTLTAGSPSFAQWQTYGPNFDPHSTTNVPALNTYTWVPLASDTVARAQGTNLSAYFLNDYYGTPRSPAGAWDIGACAFIVPQLSAPTGLHVVQ